MFISARARFECKVMQQLLAVPKKMYLKNERIRDGGESLKLKRKKAALVHFIMAPANVLKEEEEEEEEERHVMKQAGNKRELRRFLYRWRVYYYRLRQCSSSKTGARHCPVCCLI